MIFIIVVVNYFQIAVSEVFVLAPAAVGLPEEHLDPDFLVQLWKREESPSELHFIRDSDSGGGRTEFQTGNPWIQKGR